MQNICLELANEKIESKIFQGDLLQVSEAVRRKDFIGTSAAALRSPERNRNTVNTPRKAFRSRLRILELENSGIAPELL